MRKNYIILFIGFISMCFIVIGCNDVVNSNNEVSNTDFEASETFLYEVEIVDQTQFRLEGISGDININGAPNATSVLITGERIVGSDSMEDAEEHLEELLVILHELTDEVFVETIQPEDTNGRNYQVNYTVTLPRNMQLVITNVNGVVAIETIDNTTLVTNVNGQIIFDDITASINAQLVNGSICGNMSLPLNGTLIVSNINGLIDLEIPEDTSAQFYAELVNGSIIITNLDLEDEIITNTSVTGTLGDGSGTITLSNVNGNILVTGY